MQSLWMLFAAFMFSIMGVCVKLASGMYSTSEIVMYRNLVGSVALFFLILARGRSFRTRYWREHLARGGIGVMALWMWFYAISHLPLAAGMTLNYMAPIWMAFLLLAGGLWRGRRGLEWGLTLAILCSFAGVTLLLRPSFGADDWLAGLVGLGSGMLSAFAYLQVRKLGQLGEPEERVVFFFSLTGVAAGFAGTLLGDGGKTAMWSPHSGYGVALLLAIGASATSAQIAMTRAYRLGKTLVTANLQYSGIIFATVWGMLLFGDVLGWMSWLGIAIILVSGSVATYYNTRKAAVPESRPTVAKANDPIATEV